MPEPLIRNVSDTARWVATYRADETARPDAIFRDPLADRLAGERGREIVRALPRGTDAGWSMVVRTAVFDEMILEAILRGADAVLNLAAGFDTRPYRLPLPADLPWFEADLPPLVAEKESLLANERPVCRIERIAVDLADREARRRLFERVAAGRREVFVLSEGLVTYLRDEEVAALASDLHAAGTLRHWALDLISLFALRMAKRSWGRHLTQAPFRFAPAEGERFFAPFGWRPAEVRSSIEEGERLDRRPPIGPLGRFVLRVLPGPLHRSLRKVSLLVRLERV
ncbi:MAG TPA: SAM-dependent methyltransferase [Thermoanaerobaculia bacterium]|nr:SAM-dependent methyltransferase [Thermoanaerobaculia bacterium]